MVPAEQESRSEHQRSASRGVRTEPEPAVEERAVEVADEGADVAVLPLLLSPDELLLQKLAQLGGPQRRVAAVAAEDALVVAVRQAQLRV